MHKIKQYVLLLELLEVPEGVRRRAHLYHELKVISALRKKLRERRLKAAARKKAKKTEG